MKKVHLDKLLHIAIVAAYEAGVEIIKVRNSVDIGAVKKIDKSYVTDADINANNVIMSALKQTGISIISEEIDNDIKRSNIVWIVDPLDGTSEFVAGGEEFTVNIALIENRKVVLGVVYVPMTKELYFAHKYIGSYKIIGDDIVKGIDYLIDKSVKLPYTKTEVYTIVASKLNLDKKTKFFIDTISEGKEVVYKNRSSSLKFCMIAEGNADIYPRYSCIFEWDTAASHAIVKFAGKNIYTLYGYELTYNKKYLMNPYFIVK